MTSVTTATIAPGNPTAMPMIASVVRPFLDSDAGVGADWDVFKIPDDPMPKSALSFSKSFACTNPTPMYHLYLEEMSCLDYQLKTSRNAVSPVRRKWVLYSAATDAVELACRQPHYQ